MEKIRLLKKEQVNKLELLKKIKPILSDYAKLLGCFSVLDNPWYYTCSSYNKYYVFVVNHKGEVNIRVKNNESIYGIRPVISYKDVEDIIKKQEDKIILGRTPFNVVDDKTSLILDNLFNNNLIEKYKTNRLYTYDRVDNKDNYSKLKLGRIPSYKINNKEYVLFMSNINSLGQVLSNNKKVDKIDEKYWLEVEDIIWLLDDETNLLIAKDIILSGIKYANGINYNERYNNTNLEKFLNTSFFSDYLFLEKSLDDKRILKRDRT